MQAPVKPFNSTLEISLRALFILSAAAPQELSLQRLVYLDYLTIHSEDVVGGPKSIHPALPNRTGEWLLRRETLQKSLALLVQRELAQISFLETGIYYGATALTTPFIDHFATEYALRLRERGVWAVQNFASLNDAELAGFMNTHIAAWSIGGST